MKTFVLFRAVTVLHTVKTCEVRACLRRRNDIVGRNGVIHKSEVDLFDNGTLAQLVVEIASLPTWVLIRLMVHWLTSAGMVCLLSFLAVPLFGLTAKEAWALGGSILVGSPLLLCLSAIASSLTLSLKNGAVLVPLTSLPMQLPVLIFATGAVGQFAMGLNGFPILALLLAGSIAAIIITPMVIAFSLKLAWLS